VIRIRNLRRPLVAAVACIVVPALALAAKPFTMEQVRDYVYPEAPVSAAKAPRVAWVSTDEGRRNIWVAEGPAYQARQLTAYAEDDGQEITSVSLTPDGSQLVFVRGGEHGANWDEGLPVNVLSHPAGTKMEVWAIAFSGGAPRLLGEGDYPVVSPDGTRAVFAKGGALWVASLGADPQSKQLFTIRGETGEPAWSPDGGKLAFVSSRGSHSLIGVYVDERTPIHWLAPSTSRDASPRWSPDGKRIAFVRRPGGGGTPMPLLTFEPNYWELWVADVASGEGKRRYASGWNVDNSDWGFYLEWSASGRLLYKSYLDGWQHLYSLGESGEPLKLTEGAFMVEDVALSPDRKFLVYNANTGDEPGDFDRRHLFRVEADQARPQQLTSGASLEWSPAITPDERLVFISATAQRPPALAISGVKGGAVRLLNPSSISPEYPADQLVVPTPVSFKAADGLTVYGQVFAPKEGAKGKRPAVVYVHGGPPRQMLLGWHYMDYYSNDYAVNQYLASRGYVVLALNYRLGIGYGREFQYPAAAGRRGASEYQDVVAAGKYLQSLPEVDAKRVGIYGGSYGGYLTAMALSRNSDIFVVGVDIHGVHDWVSQGDFMSVFRGKTYEMPPDAKQAADVAWTSSPASSVVNWKSPVLFIHGDDDRNVDISQTVDLVQRLRKTDVKFEELVLVDETHSIKRHSNVLRMNDATVEFLDRHLMPGKAGR
jgi:dipeptidyl aminopeptidase/acylaminoacyl peptidase